MPTIKQLREIWKNEKQGILPNRGIENSLVNQDSEVLKNSSESENISDKAIIGRLSYDSKNGDMKLERKIPQK